MSWTEFAFIGLACALTILLFRVIPVAFIAFIFLLFFLFFSVFSIFSNIWLVC